MFNLICLRFYQSTSQLLRVLCSLYPSGKVFEVDNLHFCFDFLIHLLMDLIVLSVVSLINAPTVEYTTDIELGTGVPFGSAIRSSRSASVWHLCKCNELTCRSVTDFGCYCVVHEPICFGWCHVFDFFHHQRQTVTDVFLGTWCWNAYWCDLFDDKGWV